jgi:hypothetical protein
MVRIATLVLAWSAGTASVSAQIQPEARGSSMEEARSRWTDLLDRHCAGPDASVNGLEAYASLVQLALARGDGAEVRRLDRSIEMRGCTFDPARRWRPAGAFTTAVIDTTEARLRSLAERAWANERDGQRDEALRAYLQLAASAHDAETSAAALSRGVAVSETERDRATLVDALRSWLTLHADAPRSTDARLEVLSNLAVLLHTLGRDAEAQAARAELAQLGRARPLPPSWPLAHAIAEARLESLHAAIARLRVASGRQADARAYVQAIRMQIDRNAQEIAELVAQAAGWLDADTRLAARVLEGEAYDGAATAIAQAILEPLPDDLHRRMRGTGVPPQLDLQFTDQVRQVLDEQTRPLHCAAFDRYAQALIDAETLGEDDASLDVARERLQAAEQESVEACLQDRPRHLQVARTVRERPRQGLTLDLPSTAAPPALVH